MRRARKRSKERQTGACREINFTSAPTHHGQGRDADSQPTHDLDTWIVCRQDRQSHQKAPPCHNEKLPIVPVPLIPDATPADVVSVTTRIKDRTTGSGYRHRQRHLPEVQPSPSLLEHRIPARNHRDKAPVRRQSCRCQRASPIVEGSTMAMEPLPSAAQNSSLRGSNKGEQAPEAVACSGSVHDAHPHRGYADAVEAEPKQSQNNKRNVLRLPARHIGGWAGNTQHDGVRGADHWPRNTSLCAPDACLGASVSHKR